jgi:hypothetical protein
MNHKPGASHNEGEIQYDCASQGKRENHLRCASHEKSKNQAICASQHVSENQTPGAAWFDIWESRRIAKERRKFIQRGLIGKILNYGNHAHH